MTQRARERDCDCLEACPPLPAKVFCESELTPKARDIVALFEADALRSFADTKQYDRMVEMLLSYPFKLAPDTSAYFLEIIEGLNPRRQELKDCNLIFLLNYFLPLLLAGTEQYDRAHKKALEIVEHWERPEQLDTKVAPLLLHAVYSVLAYVDMHICTKTHQYRAAEYMRKALEYLEQSTIPPQQPKGLFVTGDIRSYACLVGIDAQLEEFDQCLESSAQLETYITKTPFEVYTGYSDLAFCEFAFFKNDLTTAWTHAINAVMKSREKGQGGIEALAKNYLLFIALQEGNSTLCKRLLKQMQSQLGDPNLWSGQLYYDLYVAAFYARIGAPQLVPSWLISRQYELNTEIPIPSRRLYASALYHIVTKQYREALSLISGSYPRDEHEQILFGELRLFLLSAVAKLHTGDSRGALRDFERAYTLSFQGSFEMFFIELGEELHPLVKAASKSNECSISKEWLKRIDYKARVSEKKVAVVSIAIKNALDLTESPPLSKRENTVLVDLYHGLSRDEIAENQVLSVHTVKKILQSIYRKLGAESNIDAIRIALEYGLIE